MLKVYFILGLFCCIFWKNYELHVIIYTPIHVLHLGMVLFYVLRFLDLFPLASTPIEYILTSHRCPQDAVPIEKKELENLEIEPTTDAQ